MAVLPGIDISGIPARKLVDFSRRLLSKHADDLPEKWREQALSSERVRGLKVLSATKENTEWVLGRLEAREQWSPSA